MDAVADDILELARAFDDAELRGDAERLACREPGGNPAAARIALPGVGWLVPGVNGWSARACRSPGFSSSRWRPGQGA
jgi:hypothetical protein